MAYVSGKHLKHILTTFNSSSALFYCHWCNEQHGCLVYVDFGVLFIGLKGFEISGVDIAERAPWRKTNDYGGDGGKEPKMANDLNAAGLPTNALVTISMNGTISILI